MFSAGSKTKRRIMLIISCVEHPLIFHVKIVVP
jgi:hypothetical protein